MECNRNYTLLLPAHLSFKRCRPILPNSDGTQSCHSFSCSTFYLQTIMPSKHTRLWYYGTFPVLPKFWIEVSLRCAVHSWYLGPVLAVLSVTGSCNMPDSSLPPLRAESTSSPSSRTQCHCLFNLAEPITSLHKRGVLGMLTCFLVRSLGYVAAWCKASLQQLDTTNQ